MVRAAATADIGLRSFGSNVWFMKEVSGMLTVSLRLVAIVISMVMLATGCGGDTGSSESGGDTGSSQSASDTGSSESGEDVDSNESGDDVGSAASGRAHCDVAREQEVRSDAFSPFGAESADVEAFFNDQFALIAEGIAAAPNGAIKADLELLQRGQLEMASIMEAADWDIFAVDSDAMDELNDRPELTAASDRLDAYGEAECGIQSDVSDGDAGDDEAFEGSPELLEEMLESPAMRAFIIEDMMSDSEVTEDQANCFLDSIVELGLFSALGDEEPGAAQLIAMLEVFDRCGIDPDTFGG